MGKLLIDIGVEVGNRCGRNTSVKTRPIHLLHDNRAYRFKPGQQFYCAINRLPGYITRGKASGIHANLCNCQQDAQQYYCGKSSSLCGGRKWV